MQRENVPKSLLPKLLYTTLTTLKPNIGHSLIFVQAFTLAYNNKGKKIAFFLHISGSILALVLH